MKYSREIGFNVLSIGLGVLVGVGSMLHVESAFDPNVVQSGGVERVGDIEVGSASRRDVRRAARLRYQKDVEEASQPEAVHAASEEEVMEPASLCGALEDIVASLRRQIFHVIPEDYGYAFIENGVNTAFDGALAVYCPAEEEAVHEAASPDETRAIPVRVDNNCEDFTPRRRVQCEEYERQGVRWEPNQRD